MLKGQRFSSLDIARTKAIEIANELECNVPIYYDEPYYYHWGGETLIEWVKPNIEDCDGY